MTEKKRINHVGGSDQRLMELVVIILFSRFVAGIYDSGESAYFYIFHFLVLLHGICIVWEHGLGKDKAG